LKHYFGDKDVPKLHPGPRQSTFENKNTSKDYLRSKKSRSNVKERSQIAKRKREYSLRSDKEEVASDKDEKYDASKESKGKKFETVKYGKRIGSSVHLKITRKNMLRHKIRHLKDMSKEVKIDLLNSISSSSDNDTIYTDWNSDIGGTFRGDTKSEDDDFRGVRKAYSCIKNHNLRLAYNKNHVGNVITLNNDEKPNGMHILDSGCNMSCTGDLTLLSNVDTSAKYRNLKFEVADGTTMTTDGVGYIGKLKVLYVKQMGTQCLISVSQICKAGYKICFTDTGFNVVNSENNEIIFDGILENGLYLANLPKIKTSHLKNNKRLLELRALKSKLEHLQSEHARLGHNGNQLLKNALKKQLCDGIDLDINDFSVKLPICEHCEAGKSKTVHFKETADREVDRVGELVHWDLEGPLPKSLNGNIYLCCITERGANIFWLYPCKDKRQETMIKIFEYWFQYEVVASRQVVRNIRTDYGGEWIGDEFNTLLSSKGIKHEYSQPRNPQQNSHVERKFAYINSIARALLHQCQTIQKMNEIPLFLWEDAVKFVQYCVNRLTPSNLNENISAYEHWYGKKPTLKYILTFGQTVYIHNDEHFKRKFTMRSEKGIFIGCVENRVPGYVVYLPATQEVLIVRNLRTDLISKDEGVRLVIDEQDTKEDVEPEMELAADEKTIYPYRIEDINENTEMEQMIIPRKKSHIIEYREPYPKRLRANKVDNKTPLPKAIAKMNKRTPDSYILPKSYKDAISGEDKDLWKIGIMRELDSIDRRKTFIKVNIKDCKDIRNMLGTKYVWKHKFDLENDTVEYKVRLVAQGFSQKEGIDYDQAYSPVASMDTFKVVLTLAARYGWQIHSMDVDSAYLNGELNHKIYSKIPEGYRTTDEIICTREHDLIADPKIHAFIIDKPIYGLVQSGRQWNERLVNFIKDKINYKLSVNDLSLFIYIKNMKRNYILIYVDDILIFGDDNDEIQRVKLLLNNEFEMKDLGECSKFLGLKIQRDFINRKIYVSASQYTSQLIRDFDMTDDEQYPILHIPFNTTKKISIEQSPSKDDKRYIKIMSRFPFRKLYGKLNWLCNVLRKDIEVAMGYVGAYLSNPGIEHWIALIEILQYLKGTINMRMIYGRQHSKKPFLYAHSDASYANPMDQFRSRSGGVIFYDNTALLCYSRKQTHVATGTMEAELIAALEIVKEVQFYIDMLSNFGIQNLTPVPIYIDNKATLHLIDHPTGRRTRQLEAKMANIRQLKGKILEFLYIISPANTADQFTNARPRKTFEIARSQIGLMLPEESE
jgi:hypothetical protein